MITHSYFQPWSLCFLISAAMDTSLPSCLLSSIDCILSSHVPEEFLPLLSCLSSDFGPQREFCLFLGSTLFCDCSYIVQHKHDSFETLWLLSACHSLRLSILSHTVLTDWSHSCAGYSSMGISSRDLQGTLHPRGAGGGGEDRKFLYSDSLKNHLRIR